MNTNTNNNFRNINQRRFRNRDPPSFSSTLLDSIYHSFDDPMSHKNSQICTDRKSRASRDRIVDSWMEDEFGDRRRSLPATSSDSSSLGFSSSDADSSKKNKSLKPIRTSSAPKSSRDDGSSGGGGGRSTAKSRAMKFYGDLKRMKQPISPGGKLASFLNSLFTAPSTAKKQRISTSTTTTTPSCSTASSYSRSCLSKTTNSTSSAAKRSVRFSPVIKENIDVSSLMEKNRRVEEAAKEMVRNYNKKWEVKESVREEEDEVESCCSSDLFELENLLEIGVVDRYCAELPVYETTHLTTNRAIATAFLL